MALWEQRWQQGILNTARARYCDIEMGEQLGWLMSPVLNGFYYGYLATKDPRWIVRLVDWTDSWIQRGVIEPDGFVGWPKIAAAGTEIDNLDAYYADSLLGEAMVLRPVVLMAALIRKDPALTRLYGTKAEDYLKLAQSIFRKWDYRGVWRPVGNGMISIVLPVGINRDTQKWTEDGSERSRTDKGFSHQNNKANLVALWLVAMFDATGEKEYRQRAERWFELMKSRMKLGSSRSFEIWNYWEPAGPWDYRPDGAPKHWIGVHPNAGYYAIDVEAIVIAYEHGLVFTRDDIDHLIQTTAATGRLWPALAPYNQTIRRQLEDTLQPESWAGLSLVPWYLSTQPGAR